MTREPAFIFHDLSAGYADKTILHELSGEIATGEVTALIGPNGSGKSTLVKALGGFLPFTGSLSLFGRELHRTPRRELGRLIGVVAQQAGVKAAFTAYDVIGFGRLPHQPLLGRLSADDERIVLEAARRLDIEHLLFRPVTELSGGERQRVLLAMVVAQNAPVCLLDEPTSAMDPCQALHAFSLMRALAREGKAVVVVVHDINAALSCADSFIALRAGRIVARGHASEISGEVLEALYDTPFIPYVSSRGDKVWHPVSNNS